jgi:3-phenylpropionate/trans-cinnamate dioxygenase ferredoxin reductase subunit
MDRLLVVGASYAGLHLAASARDHGWAGPITMLSAESWMPYERPPLSKAFLTTDSEPAELALRGASFYQRNAIDLQRSTRIVDIDHRSRRARAQDGQVLAYRALAIATGSTPRRLAVPGSELAGVHHLATLDEALELRAVLPGAQDVVVIGAGFIGLEIAATLRALGRRVQVLEAAPRVMSRVLSQSMSDFLDALHRERGVRIHLGQTCAEILGQHGRVTGVRTHAGAVFWSASDPSRARSSPSCAAPGWQAAPEPESWSTRQCAPPSRMWWRPATALRS